METARMPTAYQLPAERVVGKEVRICTMRCDPDGMPLPACSAPIPTLDEIDERRERIKRQWDESTRHKRKVGGYEPWTPPEISGEQALLAMNHLLDDDS